MERRLLLYNTYVGQGDNDAKWTFYDLSYSFTNALDGGLQGVSVNQIRTVVAESFAMWAAVSPLKFVEQIDPNPSLVTDETYDGSGLPAIRIGQHNIGGPNGTLAHAYRPGDGGLNGDLHFDISETWTFGSGGGPPYDMMETAAHEIGHAIGLDHESVNPALMVANYAGRYSGSGTGFLLQDDINGIQSLYGSGLGYVMDVFGNMWVGGTSGSNTINVNYNSSTNEITVTSSGFGGFTRSAAGITKLRILGSSGSDVIEVNSVPFTVEVDGGTGTDVLKLFGGSSTNVFTLNGNQVTGHSVSTYSNFESLVVVGGNAGDLFTVNSAPTIPVTLNGAGGPDQITLNVLSTNLAVFPDTGNDIIEINEPSAPFGAPTITLDAYDGDDLIKVRRLDRGLILNCGVGNDTVDVARAGAASAILGSLTINGDVGNDTVNLAPAVGNVTFVITASVTFNGGGGDDALNIGSGRIDSVASIPTFNGGTASGPGGDRITLNNELDSQGFGWTLSNSSVVRDSIFTDVNFTNLLSLTINCGNGADSISIPSTLVYELYVNGNGGNDNFIVGDGNLNLDYTAQLDGGGGVDQITYDNHLDNTGRNYDVYPTEIRVTLQFGGLFLGNAGFEAMGLLTGTGDDTIRFYNEITKPVTVDTGPGTDAFISSASDGWSINCIGGTGHDYLDVDDRGIAASFDESTVTPTAISRIRYSGGIYTVNYDSVEDIDYHLPNAQNFVSIYGTSPDIDPGYATEIHGNSSDDVFALYPFDGSGNPTLNTDLYLNGGLGSADQVQVNATGTTFGSTYTFSNPFGSIAHVFGLGPGRYAVRNDIETHTINAGSGLDTFDINAYVSGTALNINGNGGNDIVNFTPLGQDLGAITNMSSFNFNGGADYDYLVVHNGNSTAFNYYVYNGGTSAFRNSDGKSWGMPASNTEALGIYGGAFNDTFQIFGTSPGVFTELFGQGGSDTYTVGGILSATMQIINSPLRIHGEGGGTDAIQFQNGEDTTGRTFHIAQDAIGKAAGDNLFAPGGYVDFWSFTGSVTVNNGSGADTIYAVPNTQAPLSINGANPTSAPGDRLNLALAGASGINFTPGGTGAGSYTFSNRAPLSYTGIETKLTDDIAPQILTAGFDSALGGQSISFSFNEDVSASLNVNSLQLFNNTIGANVNASDMTYQYLPGNIARWTFPGLGGMLAGGSFSATIVGATDLAGNPATGNALWRFIWARGTTAADTFSISRDSGSGKTFEVFVNGSPTPTYTAPANSLNQLAVWGNDGNDTLIINARRGGRPTIPSVGVPIFDGGNGTDTVSVLATTAAESVTFSTGQIAYVTTTLTYVGAEQAAFDEADGGTGDAVTISGGPAVRFARTQRLASLSIASAAAAIVSAGANATLVVNALSLGASGSLDLTDNDLVVNNGSYSVIRDWVLSGFGNTTGIISSTSDGAQILALFDNGLVGAGEWNGVPIGGSAIVGKYTYFGDANLDGQVTGDDYTVIDANLNSTPPMGLQWLSGDMNLDGSVSGDDYTVIDANLGLGNGNPLSPQALADKRDDEPLAAQRAIDALEA